VICILVSWIYCICPIHNGWHVARRTVIAGEVIQPSKYFHICAKSNKLIDKKIELLEAEIRI